MTQGDRGFHRGRTRWLPAWLQHYRRSQGIQDGIAGLVVTVLLVPQSLAYAMLAGLPPHVGMYASILPLLAYAAFGSSMTLAVGPVAVASLMTASALAAIAVQGSPEYFFAGHPARCSGWPAVDDDGWAASGLRRQPAQSLCRERIRHGLSPADSDRPV